MHQLIPSLTIPPGTKSFTYEIYAGTSKAAHKVFQQRRCIFYQGAFLSSYPAVLCMEIMAKDWVCLPSGMHLQLHAGVGVKSQVIKYGLQKFTIKSNLILYQSYKNGRLEFREVFVGIAKCTYHYYKSFRVLQ